MRPVMIESSKGLFILPEFDRAVHGAGHGDAL